MIVWYLWFVITISEGHLGHFPMTDSYRTQAECESAMPEVLALITEQFPNDHALKVYCEAVEEGL